MKLPQSIIHSVRTLADGCVRITLDCQEMNPQSMAELFTLKQQGELIEVETENEGEPKTKSERLRGVLFVLWKEKGGEGDFDAFYRTQMEKIIDIIKSKIN